LGLLLGLLLLLLLLLLSLLRNLHVSRDVSKTRSHNVTISNDSRTTVDVDVDLRKGPPIHLHLPSLTLLLRL
jgi:hypothetical protein